MPATKNRVWLITGTSSGLGKALVDIILASGERVAATSRNASGLAHWKEKYPDQILPVSLDVTDQKAVVGAIDATVKHFGRIDVVVNNAGYVVLAEIEGIPMEDARKQFDTQFWGPVYVMREMARVFREQGTGGYVFNISSIGGFVSNPTIAFYNSSKFALEGFTQSFLKEMDPSWNIRGAIIEPGGFDSEWKGSSAQKTPQHPAYTSPENPCTMFRQVIDASHPSLGSSEGMAKALYKLADEPKLPLRVQLGSDALFLARRHCEKTIADGEEWAHVSRSSDKPEMDAEAHVRMIAQSIKF